MRTTGRHYNSADGSETGMTAARHVGSLLLLVLLVHPSVKPETPKSGGSRIAQSNVNWAKRALQGFSMRMWLSNQMTIGQQAWDSRGGDPLGTIPIGLEYPVGSKVEHLYGAGPWFGGIVNGNRRVSEGYNGSSTNKYFVPDPNHPLRERIWVSDASQPNIDLNFDPPRMLAKSVNRRSCDDDGDGKIDEDELDGLDNDGDWIIGMDDVGADGIPDANEVGCRGAYHSTNNPDPAYDNFHNDTISLDICHRLPSGVPPRMNDPDKYTERNGMADHGEPNVDEDYAAISDHDLYCSATDTVSQPGHVPMGIKVIQKSFAWRGEIGEAILPMEYTFINIGTNTVRDAYVGFFVDSDVGPTNVVNYFTRNYICYYDSLRTAYAHNPIDRRSTPIGLTLLSAPRPLSEVEYNFHWFDFTTNPTRCNEEDSCLYLEMNGELFGPRIDPCQSPTSPSDSRFLFSFGKFGDLRPGDSLKFSVCWVSGDGLGQGPNNMISNAKKAILFHKRGYTVPARIPSPTLSHDYGNRSIRLRWSAGQSINPMEIWDDSNKFAEMYPDTHWRRRGPPCAGPEAGICPVEHTCTIDSAGNYRLSGGRIFEGYRLYRSEDQSDAPDRASFVLLREYDIASDGIGFDLGLDSTYTDSMLTPGRRYWYSVTSTSIPNLTIIERPNPSGTGILRDTLITVPTESSITENMISVFPRFSASAKADQVLVVPNPYRGDYYYTDGNGYEGREYNWTPEKRAIWFIHLPEVATIRIFTVAGDVVTTLYHDDAARSSSGKPTGQEEWNLFSESGRPIASGLYVFSVESKYGKQIGRFVVIM